MDYELRRAARMAMRGVPERLGLRFADGNVEMRAKANGTGGTSFEYSGYASVYNSPFDMWDQNGEPFTEYVAPGAFRRSLSNPNLDVPFLIGHNDAGIPLARTKSGTMQLSEDSHGLMVHVPSMDGRREEVRSLASAVERGDMDEMSLAFVCNRQQWDNAYEKRGILEADVHRGDVCAVTHGANAATAGSSMMPVEQLAYRRPASIGAPRLTDEDRGLWVPPGVEERAALSTADVNDLPDSAFAYIEPGGEKDGDGRTTPRSLRHYPVQDKAHADNAAARAAAQMAEGGDAAAIAKKALPAIHAAQQKFGGEKSADSRPVELRAAHAPFTGTHSHPHTASGEQGGDATHEHEHSHDGDAVHGHSHESRADGRPLERLASAASDINSANAPDYDPAATDHPQAMACKTCKGNGSLPHPVTGGDGPPCPSCNGTGAVVTVDDSTGIPAPEQSLSAGRRLELRLRELELDELARPAACTA